MEWAGPPCVSLGYAHSVQCLKVSKNQIQISPWYPHDIPTIFPVSRWHPLAQASASKPVRMPPPLQPHGRKRFTGVSDQKNMFFLMSGSAGKIWEANGSQQLIMACSIYFPNFRSYDLVFLSQNGEDQYNMITWMWKLAINTRILFWFSCFICERYVGRSCLMDADGFIFYSFLILFWLFEPNRDNRFESLVEASVQFLAGKIIGWFHGANPNNSWWSWLSFPWFYFTCSIIFPYFPSSSLIFHRRAVWSFSGCSRPLRRRPTSWCLAVVHVQLVVVGPNTIPTIGFEWVVSSH